MSQELIKPKLIQHLKDYGFEYSWFEDENGNRINYVDTGILSFDVPVKFYSIYETTDESFDETDIYELHIENSSINSPTGVRIVIYCDSFGRNLKNENICTEYIDVPDDIPLAINKVLCSIASNFKPSYTSF
ncbi:hypothetical protein IQ277_10835 [Nostocales cyanobacterium LEGE 12452]|nr:hypothetical protein [Nostocales cyanobacterium LEGE 12452]